MSRPKPLFLMGNKRSGSTLTVNLLNSHPRLFVSHESDIAWILYQARNGPPAKYVPHPLDSDMMMTQTVRVGRRVLRDTLGTPPTTEQIRDAFFDIEFRLMRRWLRWRSSLHGRAWKRIKAVGKKPTMKKIRSAMAIKPDPLVKDDLLWIGDKKHAQHLDPDIRGFLGEHFPDASYIHIVRNPKGVVASMVDASENWWVMPDFFKGTAEEILEQWATHEEWVLEAKQAGGSPIHTVRLEDLCQKPHESLEKMYGFLGLEMDDAIRDRVDRLVATFDPNRKYASFPLPELPRARRIMEVYCYS